MPGINEDDIVPLAKFALRKGAQLRFIEQMPLGPREQWKRSDMVTADDILRRLSEEISLTPAEDPRGSGTAQLRKSELSLYKHIDERNIGVIAAVTRLFCGDCDRTR